MVHLLRLFFALAFEQKAGTFSGEDLKERTDRALTGLVGKEQTPPLFRRVGAKYPGISLYDPILSDEIVYDLLVRGVINAEALRRSLDESSWFASKDEPAWRTVWYAAERSDDAVKAAAQKMQEEFAARHFTKSGEILHVCGQMLWLSDIGVSNWDRARTVVKCKAYIDDIRRSGELEAPSDTILDDLRYGAYAGLGFSQNTTPEFQEVWTYLRAQRAEEAVDRYAEQAKTLAAMASADPSAFVRQIAHHHDSQAAFANIPVFSALDPDRFAEQLIALQPLAFREVLLGFSSRYDMGRLSRELAGERQWAEELESILLRKAEDQDAIARDRLSKNVHWTLGEELKKLRDAEVQQANQVAS